MPVFVVLLVVVAAVVAVALVQISLRATGPDETERFHRARMLTSGWAASSAAEPVREPALEEDYPAEGPGPTLRQGRDRRSVT